MSSKEKDDAQEHVSGQANKPMTAPAHALAIDRVVDELKANVEVGLSDDEAKRRLEEYGRNEFGEQKGVQPVKIFIGQIANALTLVRLPYYMAIEPNPSQLLRSAIWALDARNGPS